MLGLLLMCKIFVLKTCGLLLFPSGGCGAAPEQRSGGSGAYTPSPSSRLVLTACILTGIDTSFFLIGIDASVFLIGINATTFFHVDITSSSLPSSAGVDAVNAIVLLCWSRGAWSRTYCLLDLLPGAEEPGAVPAACWICCLEQRHLEQRRLEQDLLPAGSAAWSRGAWRWRRLELEAQGRGGGAGPWWSRAEQDLGGGGAKVEDKQGRGAYCYLGGGEVEDAGRRWKTPDRDSNLAKG